METSPPSETPVDPPTAPAESQTGDGEARLAEPSNDVMVMASLDKTPVGEGGGNHTPKSSCDIGGNHTPQSCDTGPARQRIGSVSGILKHVSQFDTPSSAHTTARRVQFASEPDVKETLSGGNKATPKQGEWVWLGVSGCGLG